MTKKEMEENIAIITANIEILTDAVNDLYSRIGASNDDTDAVYRYDKLKGCVKIPKLSIKEEINELYERIDILNINVQNIIHKINSM